MPAVRVLISGEVQGVFFRATAKEVAERHGITGWVKNTIHGNVEAEVQGDEKALQAFTDWCRQGPSRAEVREVIITNIDPIQHTSFSIIR